MTPPRSQRYLIAALTLYDALTSPEAKDFYAGALALAGLALVAELVLGMFGR